MDSKTSNLLKFTFKIIAAISFVIAAMYVTGIVQILPDTKI